MAVCIQETDFYPKDQYRSPRHADLPTFLRSWNSTRAQCRSDVLFKFIFYCSAEMLKGRGREGQWQRQKKIKEHPDEPHLVRCRPAPSAPQLEPLQTLKFGSPFSSLPRNQGIPLKLLQLRRNFPVSFCSNFVFASIERTEEPDFLSNRSTWRHSIYIRYVPNNLEKKKKKKIF